MPVRRAFDITSQTTVTPIVVNSWQTLTLNPIRVPCLELAESIAEHMMLTLFGGTPVIMTAWKDKRLRGIPHPDQAITDQLEDILERQIGLPGRTPRAINPNQGRYAGQEKLDHLEGFVAEHLWHLATTHQIYGGPYHRVNPISFRVTDSGADGFVIFEPTPGQYHYRLWEIKKNSTGRNPRPTAVDACVQLAKNATYYLQELSKVGEHESDATLKTFYSNIVFHWRRQHPEANAGVALVVDQGRAGRNPFDMLGSVHLTALAGQDRLHGLQIEVQDVRKLAEDVRTVIWSGL